MKGSHGENMNILKKGSTALLLFVLLLMALPVFGASPEYSAQTVDPAVPGKILIRYRAGADGTKPVAGASFTVYRIAETGERAAGRQWMEEGMPLEGMETELYAATYLHLEME